MEEKTEERTQNKKHKNKGKIGWKEEEKESILRPVLGPLSLSSSSPSKAFFPCSVSKLALQNSVKVINYLRIVQWTRELIHACLLPSWVTGKTSMLICLNPTEVRHELVLTQFKGGRRRVQTQLWGRRRRYCGPT